MARMTNIIREKKIGNQVMDLELIFSLSMRTRKTILRD